MFIVQFIFVFISGLLGALSNGALLAIHLRMKAQLLDPAGDVVVVVVAVVNSSVTLLLSIVVFLYIIQV